MNNEGLHSQNWRLEVKNGVKGPELGRDGMAITIDELKKQLDNAKQSLERAQADRADMDSEVTKAQEKVDRIQAKLEVAEKIEEIVSGIKSLESQISKLKQNKEQIDALKKSIADLTGEDSEDILLGFDTTLEKVDQKIQALSAQKANLKVYSLLREANLKGEFNDEDRVAILEVLKDSTPVLTDEVRDRALRIAEKTKRSQIKDAQELIMYKEDAKKLKGLDLARLNREIALLENSLANAGIDANDEEQMSELLGLDIKKPNTEAGKDTTPKENTENQDPAQETFTKKFIESSGLLVSLDEAISKLDKTSPNFDELNKIISLLEINAKEVEEAIGQVKDQEKKQKYQEGWNKKGVASKIEAAKKIVANSPEVDEEASETAGVTNNEEETNGEVDGTAQGSEVGGKKEEMAEGAEAKSRFPRITKIFNSIRNKFVGVLNWLNKNASGHVDDEKKSTTTIKVDVKEIQKAPLSKEQEADQAYDRHNKSLDAMTETIKKLVKKRESVDLDSNDIDQLIFVIDSLYQIGSIVNDEKTILSKDQQQHLQARVYVIGDELLESRFGVIHSELMEEMEKDIPKKEKLDDTHNERIAWLTRYFSEDESGASDDSRADSESSSKESVSFIETEEEKLKRVLNEANF